VMSMLPLVVALVSVDAVAPVVLVELLVAPIVLLDSLGEVVVLGVVLLMVELGSLEREVVSVELVVELGSVEVELLGDVLLVLLELGYVLVLGDVLLAVDEVSVEDDGDVLVLVVP
jgi:hypothetical protein